VVSKPKHDRGLRFLIRGRDSKYSGPFNEIFQSEGIPDCEGAGASTEAKRSRGAFVRTVRAECLDWLLILNRRHLERILRVYVHHYNRERPHRALELRPPGRRHTQDQRLARSTVTTGSAASSTSTTEKAPEMRHELWRPSSNHCRG
jgi:Integrase core domain